MQYASVEQQRDVMTPVVDVSLAIASWIPPDPKAVFILCHGHAEHSGRYTYLVNTMVERGFAVFTLDLRGHGRSSGPRALLTRFDDFVDDLDLLVDRATARFPSLPVVTFGHSMGGLIAVRYALAHGDRISLLITSGPALIIDEGVPAPAKRVLATIARIAPMAPVPRTAGNVLSTDPEIGRQFDLDHRNHHGSTRASTVWQMIQAGEDACARLGEITLPLLVMHGEADTLTNPKGTELLYKRASSRDKTIVLWPGMKHELLNEPDRARVMQFIEQWLSHRLPARNAGEM